MGTATGPREAADGLLTPSPRTQLWQQPGSALLLPYQANTPAFFFAACADLVRRILTFDTKARANASEILAHPWLHRHGVAPDKPIDSVVISRLRNFAGMTKLRKAAVLAAAQHLRCFGVRIYTAAWLEGAAAGGGVVGWWCLLRLVAVESTATSCSKWLVACPPVCPVAQRAHPPRLSTSLQLRGDPRAEGAFPVL